MARAGVRPFSLSLSHSLPLPLAHHLPLPSLLSQYNPRAAHSLWELMTCVESDAAAAGQPISLGEKFEFLQTHPNNGQRQRHIERLLPRALDIWREATKTSSGATVASVGVPSREERVVVVEGRKEREGESVVVDATA